MEGPQSPFSASSTRAGVLLAVVVVVVVVVEVPVQEQVVVVIEVGVNGSSYNVKSQYLQSASENTYQTGISLHKGTQSINWVIREAGVVIGV